MDCSNSKSKPVAGVSQPSAPLAPQYGLQNALLQSLTRMVGTVNTHWPPWVSVFGIVETREYADHRCTVSAQTDVTRYDKQLQILAEAWQDVASADGAVMSSLRIQRNCQVSINSLPIELLCRIFLFAQASNYMATVQISHVCAHWRNIIIENSGSWSVIDTDVLSSNMSQLFVERSKGRPIIIRMNVAKHIDFINSEVWWPFMLWQRYMRRTKSADLALYPDLVSGRSFEQGSDDSREQRWFSGNSTPLLQDLSLTVLRWGMTWSQKDLIIPDLLATMPNLHTLVLSGIRLPWALGQYHGLTKLHIRLHSYMGRHKADESIVQIFSDSPHLEDFLLASQCYLHLGPDQKTPHTISQGPPLLLCRMKTISLCLSPEDMTHLLQGIALPPSTSTLFLSTDPHDILPCIPRHQDHLQNLREFSYCEINVNEGVVSLRTQGPQGIRTAAVRYGPSLGTIAGIHSAFKLLDLIHHIHPTNDITDISLVFGICDPRIIAEAFQYSLQPPSLRDITLRLCGNSAVPMVEALLGKKHLSRLTIADTHIAMDDLLNLCTSRNAQISQLILDNCTLLCETKELGRETIERIRLAMHQNVNMSGTSFSTLDGGEMELLA